MDYGGSPSPKSSPYSDEAKGEPEEATGGGSGTEADLPEDPPEDKAKLASGSWQCGWQSHGREWDSRSQWPSGSGWEEAGHWQQKKSWQSEERGWQSKSATGGWHGKPASGGKSAFGGTSAMPSSDRNDGKC